MNYKSKLLKAISEMTEKECEQLYDYTPKSIRANGRQKTCNHSMKYDMRTGGSTCTKPNCNWMS